MTPESVSKVLEEFLAGSRGAVVLEDGAVSFDLATARYSVSGEYNKCLLHLWSAERNVVRRVLDAEVKGGSLRLAVQRMGQARPSRLEICRDRDRRSPSARRAARSAYQQKCRRMLERRFYGFTISQLSTNMDLERSFGPVYARGLLKKGQTAIAVLGVNEQETQASIDASLTFGILWLDACRESQNDRTVVEGLHLFVPPKSSGIVRERMAHMNPSAAKWHLYEFDERHDEVVEIDCSDRGNIATRLVRCPDFERAYERFSGPIATVAELLPECAAVVISPAEIAFRLHGLELARARIAHSPTSFHSGTEIVFGVGAEERVLEGRKPRRFREAAAQRGRSAACGRAARPSTVADASGTVARVDGDRKSGRPRRLPRRQASVLAGSRVFSRRPRDDRCAGSHARGTIGRDRVESG